jgi:hypothetical protein
VHVCEPELRNKLFKIIGKKGLRHTIVWKKYFHVKEFQSMLNNMPQDLSQTEPNSGEYIIF